jgi:hypothetical protein
MIDRNRAAKEIRVRIVWSEVVRLVYGRCPPTALPVIRQIIVVFPSFAKA